LGAGISPIFGPASLGGISFFRRLAACFWILILPSNDVRALSFLALVCGAA
jgi:hypothetical protein